MIRDFYHNLTFDSEPVLYLAICNGLLIASAVLCFYPLFRPHISNSKSYTYFTLFLLVLTLILFRLPVIIYNQPLNPDESLFIVGAMTLAQDPVYWESVDGCTSGPFNFYIITAFCEFFKQPYDYISGRIVGVLLIIGSMLFSFFTLKKLFSTPIAFLSVFPAVAFLSTTRYSEFVHYSSEHLPIFLLSIMGYLYVSVTQQNTNKKSYLFVLGLIAGLLPFAKLQTIPIAAFIVFITYWLVYKVNKNKSLSLMASLTLGGMCIPIIMLLTGWYLGFIEEIWVYYIKYNLSYGSKNTLFNSIYLSLFDPINIFIKIIAVLVFALLIYRVFWLKQLKLSTKGIFITAFLGSSLFAVYKTGFMFHHYLLFLIFPATYLYAFFLNDFISLTEKATKYVYIGVSLILIVILSTTLILPIRNEYVTLEKQARPIPLSTVGKEILKYSEAHEPLVIWGEEGKYYLETQRLPGIRWSNSHWGMYNDSLQKLFQLEYIKEFKAASPPVFIDTHANEGSFMTRAACGYETVPELKKLVEDNYQLLAEVNQQRIFVRKDRMTEEQNEAESALSQK